MLSSLYKWNWIEHFYDVSFFVKLAKFVSVDCKKKRQKCKMLQCQKKNKCNVTLVCHGMTFDRKICTVPINRIWQCALWTDLWMR